MAKSENPKAQALVRLQSKINAAKAELATAESAVNTLRAEIEEKIKADGRGKADYSSEALRQDRETLLVLETKARFGHDGLAVLEGVLPEVELAAVREDLAALDADLTGFDSGTLAPALSRFRQTWNEMLAVVQETQEVYKARDAIFAQFKAMVKELPSEEHATTWPSVAFWLRPGFASVLEKAGVGDSGLRPLKEEYFEPRAKPKEVPGTVLGVLDGRECDGHPGPQVLSPNREDHVAWSRLPPSA
jgi:hypothetical protein